MQIKTMTVLLAAAMSGVAAACLCVTALLGWENWTLQRRLADVQANWERVVSQAAELRALQAAAQVDLSTQQQRSETLQVQLDSLRSATNEPATTVLRRPLRVRIYDANGPIGLGWVLAAPTNAVVFGTPEAPANVMLDRPVPKTVVVAPAEQPSQAPPIASSYATSWQQLPYGYWGWPVGWTGDEDRHRHDDSGRYGAGPDSTPTVAPLPTPVAPMGVKGISLGSFPTRVSVIPPALNQPAPRPIQPMTTFAGGQRSFPPSVPATSLTPQTLLRQSP
jgi:hypothetical protein